MTASQRRVELLKGWEDYPTNLSAIYDQEDLEAFHSRLKQESKRLFNSDITEIRFETVLPCSEGLTSEGDRLFMDLVTDDGMLNDILIVRLPW